jgi:hypothetical protein
MNSLMVKADARGDRNTIELGDSHPRRHSSDSKFRRGSARAEHAELFAEEQARDDGEWDRRC